MSKKAIIITAVIVLVLVAGVFFLPKGANSAKLDGFTQCLNQKGVIFYGAWWCPHCQAEKALIGADAMKYMNYVECATPDGNDQTQICKDNQISEYPTFVFADHSTTTGQVSLQELSDKTGCPLPQ